MTKLTADILRTLAVEIGERPTGTAAGEAAQDYLADIAGGLGFEITELPFDCRRWESGDSALALAAGRVPLHAGPFSDPLAGVFDLAVVETLDELRAREVAGSLLVLRGPLAAEPFMPRDFPFFYPDEHRQVLDLLLEKRPAGILAVTGRHPLCGLSPFPLFEDGNLGLPNAYAADSAGLITDGATATVEIDSASLPSTGRQLVFSRPGRDNGRIILAAHIDTKYETPGALDNAAGVATAMAVAERLGGAELPAALDIVPLNGEEHYEVSGQLAYLAYREPTPQTVRLMMNLDALGCSGSHSAFSFYNLERTDTACWNQRLEAHPRMARGEEWIAGDHAVFAFRGIRSVAVTSSNLLEEVMALTHTARDTVDRVDVELLEETSAVLAERIRYGSHTSVSG